MPYEGKLLRDSSPRRDQTHGQKRDVTAGRRILWGRMPAPSDRVPSRTIKQAYHALWQPFLPQHQHANLGRAPCDRVGSIPPTICGGLRCMPALGHSFMALISVGKIIQTQDRYPAGTHPPPASARARLLDHGGIHPHELRHAVTVQAEQSPPTPASHFPIRCDGRQQEGDRVEVSRRMAVEQAMVQPHLP